MTGWLMVGRIGGYGGCRCCVKRLFGFTFETLVGSFLVI